MLWPDIPPFGRGPSDVITASYVTQSITGGAMKGKGTLLEE